MVVEESQQVEATLYDALGRRVQTLLDDRLQGGNAADYSPGGSGVGERDLLPTDSKRGLFEDPEANSSPVEAEEGPFEAHSNHE